MKLSELAEAVTFEPDQRTLDFSAIPTDLNDLLGFTGGLLVLTGDDDIVGLAHYSIKEFLLSDRIKASSVSEFFQGDCLAHLSLVMTSMRYLMMDDFSDGPCRSAKRLESRDNNYRFLRYAGANWMMHYKALPETVVHELDLELIDMFCDPNNAKKVQSMQQIELRERDMISVYSSEGDTKYDTGERFLEGFQEVSVTSEPFYYGALYGLRGLVMRLFKKGYDINAYGGYYEFHS